MHQTLASWLQKLKQTSHSRMIHRRLKKLIEKLAARRTILPQSQLGKAVCKVA